MKPFTPLAMVALTLGLASCTSAPVHYHTLLAPNEHATAVGQPVSFLIDVLPVGVPTQVDQPQLIVRQGDSGVAVLESERWTGPLSDELRSALSAELTQRLATQDIAGLAQPSDAPILRIKLQVRRFDAWPGTHTRLDADWSMGFTHQAGRRLVCSGRFDESALGGYPEMVQAQQRMVAALANAMARNARGWEAYRAGLAQTDAGVQCRGAERSATTL